jgi:hypothetical protein
MTTGSVAPHRSPLTPERESFWYLVHAEWTKFRTVRGWVIAVLVTIVAIVALRSSALAAGAARAAGPAAGLPVRHSRPGLAVSRSWTRSTSRTSR